MNLNKVNYRQNNTQKIQKRDMGAVRLRAQGIRADRRGRQDSGLYVGRKGFGIACRADAADTASLGRAV